LLLTEVCEIGSTFYSKLMYFIL